MAEPKPNLAHFRLEISQLHVGSYSFKHFDENQLTKFLSVYHPAGCFK